MELTENGIAFYPAKAKSLAIIAGSILLACGCILLLANHNEVSGKWVLLAGVLLLVFLGLAGFGVNVLLRDDPLIELTPEGIVDRASSISVGLIRWEEMTEIIVYEENSVGFLGIMVKDIQAVLSRQQGVKKAVQGFESGKTSCIPIPSTWLPVSVEALRESISGYCSERGIQIPSP